MQTVRRILNFLIENLTDLATIFAAIVIVIRHELKPESFNDFGTVAASIVGLLALVAASGLWDRYRRHKMAALVQSTNNLVLRYLSDKPRAADFFLEGNEGRITDGTFSAGETIYICGITLTRTTRQFMHILSKRLQAGAAIRLMIIDHKKPAVMETMAARSMGQTTADYWSTRIETVVDVIKAIVSGGSGIIEIGFLPFIPSFGLTIINPSDSHSTCFVEIYHHRTAEANATFELDPTNDPYWHGFFLKQWNELWACSRIETISSHIKVHSHHA